MLELFASYIKFYEDFPTIWTIKFPLKLLSNEYVHFFSYGFYSCNKIVDKISYLKSTLSFTTENPSYQRTVTPVDLEVNGDNIE